MARPLARKRSAAAALPVWIPPQLTQLVEAAPDADDWLHEIKFDGYRMHGGRFQDGLYRMLQFDSKTKKLDTPSRAPT